MGHFFRMPTRLFRTIGPEGNNIMTYHISDEAVRLIETRYPHLQGLTDRYRMLSAMYPDTLYEFDDVLRRKGLNRDDWTNDDDLVFLKNNVSFLEDEIETTCRQLVAILRSEYHAARED